MKTLFIILALCILATSCISVKKGPVKAYTAIEQHDITFDAIIVPGVPFENNHWDSIMKARVLWSYVLYKNGLTKNIIYSGSAVYSPYYEAKIMGLYAQELGIPKSNIYYDTSARHSTENAYYSYLIAKKEGFKTVALATDPFQSAMLQSFTVTRMSTPIFHMPYILDSVKKYSSLNPTIDPTSARKNDFVSITEVETPFQRIKGTMGGDIDWKKYEDKRLPPL